MAAVVAFMICFSIGPLVIRKILNSGMVDEVREDGPSTHKHKPITPTMGGLIFIPAIVISTLLFSRLDLAHTWIVLIATIWMGVTGFVDDILKKKRGKDGLAGKYKLLSQTTLGLLIGIVVFQFPHLLSQQFADSLTLSTVPFFKNLSLDFAPIAGLGFTYVVMVIIVITGTSNSVNLADGLDGLATGLVAIIAVGLAILAYATGNVVWSEYLHIIYLPGTGELTVFCGALLGASIGFLWYNSPPASVYMGDVGSLALGAGIAAVAILAKKELFLIILGGVLVTESLSVIMQRYYFKYTRKRTGTGVRLFKMAPIHHHAELSGWAETKVVIRFWIIGLILLFLTLTSFKLR